MGEIGMSIIEIVETSNHTVEAIPLLSPTTPTGHFDDEFRNHTCLFLGGSECTASSTVQWVLSVMSP